MGRGQAQAAPKSRFNNSYGANVVITDGDLPYDTAAEVYGAMGAAGAGFFQIWRKTVLAQRGIRWGSGNALTPYNQGYMWFALLDKTTDFATGVVRLGIADAAEQYVLVVKEMDDTNRLHTTTNTTITTAQPTDMAQMIALPEQIQKPIVGEDSKIHIKYAAISRPAAEDSAGFSIPVTNYTL
ncbi:hypothetical protein [Dehalogenimonas formicexedens]|nr:hypothetical protein [Dehalogenimonas formicexedens]